MNAPASPCACGGAAARLPVLVYACSGAADVGEIADRTARRLNASGDARMSCLAGIGARVSGLTASAAAAPALLAIDGCPHDCARKVLEAAGFAAVRHVRVTDLGFAKGKSPVDADAIERVRCAAVSLLHS